MRLETATREQVAAIYQESYALWGVGLSREDYVSLWHDLSSTRWARENARFCVWLDERNQVTSSLKLYRPRIRIGDRTSRASVLGAIFTPHEFRRRGHAEALIEAVLELGRREGDGAALLFSDIGVEYYERLGFEVLPAQEQWGPLPRRPAPLDETWSLRPLLDTDSNAVREAHDDTQAARPLAFQRDASHWEFLRVRSDSYFRRLDDASVRPIAQAALRHGRFAGFFTAVEGGGEWNVREVGAIGGDPQALATILRLGAVAARQNGLRKFYGWLAPDLMEQMSDWRMQVNERRRAVPMILAFDEALNLGPLRTLAGGFIPYQDQF